MMERIEVPDRNPTLSASFFECAFAATGINTRMVSYVIKTHYLIVRLNRSFSYSLRIN